MEKVWTLCKTETFIVIFCRFCVRWQCVCFKQPMTENASLFFLCVWCKLKYTHRWTEWIRNDTKKNKQNLKNTFHKIRWNTKQIHVLFGQNAFTTRAIISSACVFDAWNHKIALPKAFERTVFDSDAYIQQTFFEFKAKKKKIKREKKIYN